MEILHAKDNVYMSSANHTPLRPPDPPLAIPRPHMSEKAAGMSHS